MISQFSFPTRIYFGSGSRKSVAGILKSQDFQRPLLVTDKGLATLKVFQDFKSDLDASGLASATFSGVVGNPVKSQVSQGVSAFKDHRADCIIGFGGGAALDVAKAIALMSTHAGDLFDYEDEKPGGKAIDGPIPYWIALPTTSGTGSEVGRSTVISDDQTHAKKIIFSPKLLAQAVFADPDLTLDLPGPVTAATGMDALTHCVEAYLAKAYHPICDGIALEGLRIAAKNLKLSVREPKNLEARTGMMMASMMGAIAFQKGLGVTHSCAHALSTVADLHHGLANGIMIDFALSFNVEAARERFATMAVTVGLSPASPESFLAWLRDLKSQIGIPKNLAGKVRADQVPALCDVAIADGCHPNNPRKCTRADFEKIFSEALS